MNTNKVALAAMAFFMTAIGSSYAQFTDVAITADPSDQSETAIAVSPLNSNYLFGAWNDSRW